MVTTLTSPLLAPSPNSSVSWSQGSSCGATGNLAPSRALELGREPPAPPRTPSFKPACGRQDLPAPPSATTSVAAGPLRGWEWGSLPAQAAAPHREDNSVLPLRELPLGSAHHSRRRVWRLAATTRPPPPPPFFPRPPPGSQLCQYGGSGGVTCAAPGTPPPSGGTAASPKRQWRFPSLE